MLSCFKIQSKLSSLRVGRQLVCRWRHCCAALLFCRLLFVVCCLLFVVCCLLFVVCCLLFVVCCLLFVVCCLLFVVCCLLFVVCCLLFVVCCLLFVVCCLFFVVCCLLSMQSLWLHSHCLSTCSCGITQLDWVLHSLRQLLEQRLFVTLCLLPGQ